MSTGSTPIHTGGPYDAYYDPEFTAEISAKMHVPDKICVVEGLQNSSSIPRRDEFRSMMNVPEKIIVAGDNKHIAVRDFVPERELKFDGIFPTIQNYILEGPPNVLTVDEYPTTDALKPSKREPKKRSVDLDKSISGMDMNESAISSAPEDEIIMLKKQLRHLSRRVLALEQENQQHQQREIILYAVGITYFVLKGLTWLHRHF